MNPNEPLGLPHGSVRAILALAVVGVFLWNWAVGDQTIPLEVVTLVVGFYFLKRSNDAPHNGVEIDPPDHPDG